MNNVSIRIIKRALLTGGLTLIAVGIAAAILPAQEKRQKHATREAVPEEMRFNNLAPSWKLHQTQLPAPIIEFNQVLADSAPATAANFLRRLMQENPAFIESLTSPSLRTAPNDHIDLPNGSFIQPLGGMDVALLKKISARAAAPLTSSAAAPADEMVIIQFAAGQLSGAELLALFDLGIKPCAHLPASSVIARVPAQNLAKLAQLPFVRWAGEYRPEYKYAPALVSNSAAKGLYVFPLGKGQPAMAQDLQTRAVEVLGYDARANVFVVRGPATMAPQLAELAWVKKIEAVHVIQPAALAANFQPRDSRELISAPYVTSFRGSRVTVGIFDTGIRNNHAAFSGRIANGPNDTNGHGTHVAGIIGASDVDGETFQGVAPLARLFMMSINSSTVDEAYAAFQANKIQVVNNSWFFLDNNGVPFFNYDGNTEIIDEYADDRLVDLQNGVFGKPLALIFIAGNSGASGIRTITNPGTGKNVLSVGALDFTVDGDAGLGRRASYSSIGPTQEGRLKPELVAPGGAAGLNDASSFKAQNGVVSANAFGVLDEADLYWPTNNQYVRLKGTSMAGPHVTGAAALAIDYWESKGWDWTYTDLKAHLINNALPLKENDGGPLSGYANTRVGYGLVNALSTIVTNEAEMQTILWGKGYVVETSNVSDDWTFQVSANCKALVATMAYSDLPGKTLQDNLDLVLIAPNNATYKHLLPINVTAESPLEKVVVVAPAAGTWTARIEYKSWPNDPLAISTQQYTVVAAAHLQTPALSVAVPNKNLNVKPGEAIALQVEVKNSGGNIAAGVTVHLEDPAANFTGEVNQKKFAGNLVRNLAARTMTFNLAAPATVGTYTLKLTADGINQELSAVTETVTVTVSAGPPPPPPKDFQITNLFPTEYQIANLKVGDTYYIDRSWTITSIPAAFQGLTWIKTAANDYNRTNFNFYFDANQDGKIYVGYDPTLTPPAWLASAYTETGQVIEVVNNSVGRLSLWESKFNAGRVTLGGNQGVFGSAMYVVLLRPASATQPPGPIATLALPRDLSGASNTLVKIPVLVTTAQAIKLAQFAVEFNDQALAYKGVQLGADVSGFRVAVNDTNPPFAPRTAGTTKNVLLQISSSTGSLAGTNREVAVLEFSVLPTTQNRTTPLAFDDDSTHTFLTTTSRTDVKGDKLALVNSTIISTPVQFPLAGTVRYVQNTLPISDVTLLLLSSSGRELYVRTSAAGVYQFLQPQDAYSLYPSKTGDVRNAITGIDAAWILEYLGFTRTLTANQIIAADVVHDGIVDGADALAILRYLVAKPDFRQTGNWTFVPPSAQIVLDRAVTQDFGAHLLGDVNGTWGMPQGEAAATAAPDHAGAIHLARGSSPSESRHAAAPFFSAYRIVPQELRIESSTETRGRFAVPLVLEPDGAANLSGLVFTVRFDAAHFNYAGFELAAAAQTFWGVENQLAAGTVRLAFAAGMALPAAGEQLRLLFEVKPTAEAHTTDNAEHVALMTLENIMIDDWFLAATNLATLSLAEPAAITSAGPQTFALQQNYPNPFNAATEMVYAIPEHAPLPLPVSLKIYDANGRLVRRFESTASHAGIYRQLWDGRDRWGQPVGSGLYFYSIHAADFHAWRKMLCLK